ncbi:DUF885 family protein [Candidatus Bipolaricaulota bacterium]
MRQLQQWILRVGVFMLACIVIGGPVGAQAPISEGAHMSFSYDYDDELSGWETAIDYLSEAGYENGEYQIQIKGKYSTREPIRESWAPLNGRLGSFQVEVTGYLSSGESDSHLGIVWGTDPGDFTNEGVRIRAQTAYYASVRSDGTYSIRRVEGFRLQDPIVDWTESPAIQTGNGLNRLVLAVGDGHGAFTVNDVELASFDFAVPGPFYVGLYAATSATFPTTARFTECAIDGYSPDVVALDASGLYVDEFDDATSGWETMSAARVQSYYENSDFVLVVDLPGWITGAYAPIDFRLTNFSVETNAAAEFVNGETYAEYGFEWGVDLNNQYLACVTADGRYVISHILNGEWQPMIADWLESDVINQGTAANKLGLVVNNKYGTFMVNDVELIKFELEIYEPSRIGLVLSTMESVPPVHARFSDFRLQDLGGYNAQGPSIDDLDGLGFDEFVEASYQLYLLRTPQNVTSLGKAEEFDIRNDTLDNYSYEYTLETFAMETAILERLRAFDLADLTEEQRATYEICEWYWDDLVRGQAFYDLEHLVGDGGGFTAYGSLKHVLAEYHPFVTEADVIDYLARLQRVGSQIDQITAELARQRALGIVAPRTMIEQALPDVESMATIFNSGHPFYVTLKDKAAAIEEVSEDELEGFLRLAEVSIETFVKPAYQRLCDKLEELLPEAPEALSLSQYEGGNDYYAYLLHHHTQTDLSAAEIHALGLQEVSRIQAELRQIAESIGIDYTYRLSKFFEDVADLSESVMGQEAIDENVRLIELAQQLIEESGAFSRLPGAEVVVEGADVGGFYSPAAADGSRPARFLATTSRPTLLFKMPSVAFHEAVPGHHVQVALAQEMDLPLIRQDIMLTGFVEGWALYAERLMGELGAYAEDPLGIIGQLQLELLRAVRLVVDTGIHDLGWDTDRAAFYIMMNVGESRALADYRVRRYTVIPGQATAYMVGLLEILELRELARTALGDAFDLATFHDIILGHGMAPLTYFRELVEAWIAEEGA